MKNVNIYGVQEMDNLYARNSTLSRVISRPNFRILDNCGEELLDILEEFMDAGNVWLTTNKSDEDIISLSNVYKLTL
jgi:hypothetical protein